MEKTEELRHRSTSRGVSNIIYVESQLNQKEEEEVGDDTEQKYIIRKKKLNVYKFLKDSLKSILLGISRLFEFFFIFLATKNIVNDEVFVSTKMTLYTRYKKYIFSIFTLAAILLISYISIWHYSRISNFGTNALVKSAIVSSLQKKVIGDETQKSIDPEKVHLELIDMNKILNDDDGDGLKNWTSEEEFKERTLKCTHISPTDLQIGYFAISSITKKNTIQAVDLNDMFRAHTQFLKTHSTSDSLFSFITPAMYMGVANPQTIPCACSLSILDDDKKLKIRHIVNPHVISKSKQNNHIYEYSIWIEDRKNPYWKSIPKNITISYIEWFDSHLSNTKYIPNDTIVSQQVATFLNCIIFLNDPTFSNKH